MTRQAVVGLAVLAALPLSFAVTSARAGRRGGARDRAGLVADFAVALVAVLVAHASVPWQSVPTAFWWALVAVTVFGVLAAAATWPRLPGLAGERRRWRAASTASTVLLSALAAALLLSS